MPKSINTLGDASRTGRELLAVCHVVECRHRQTVDLDLVIMHAGETHPLVPARGQVHFSERMRCPASGARDMYIWLGVPKGPQPTFRGAMSYQVNLGSPYREHREKILTSTGNLQAAHAAYEAALAAYPSRRITLQQRSQVVRDSRWKVIEGRRA